MYIYNLVNTTMEVIIIQFKEAKENSSDILNAPQRQPIAPPKKYLLK